MTQIVTYIQDELSNHPGTSVLIILFAFVAKQMAMLVSVFSTTYTYVFSGLSLLSVLLVVLCHWRKGWSETKQLYAEIKKFFKKKQ